MPKGITFNSKEEAREFASQFPRSEIKKVGIPLLRQRYVVYVSESELRAENYRRKLEGLPNLEDEIRAEAQQGQGNQGG